MLTGNTSALPGPDNLGYCSQMLSDILILHSDYSYSHVALTNTGAIGRRSMGRRLRILDGANTSLPNKMNSDAEGCFTWDPFLKYFLFMSGSTPLAVVMDPSPAQLTQNLSATKGASAAATDTTTGAATSTWQWPTQYSTGGSFVGGEPCSSLAQSAGYLTSGNIAKTGSYSKCMCPTGGC